MHYVMRLMSTYSVDIEVKLCQLSEQSSYRNFPLLGAYAYISTGRKWAPKLETTLNCR